MNGAVSAMIGSACCWGSATALSKHLLVNLDPWTLLLLQLGSSVLFLWGIELLVYGRQSFLQRYSCIGILEPGVAYLLNLFGLTWTSAGHAAVIGATEPLLVVPLALLFLGERSTAGAISWSVLGSAAIAFVSLEGAAEASAHGTLIGDLFVLLGVAAAALYVVSSKKFILDCPALVQARQQQCAGLIFVMVLAYFFAEQAAFERISTLEAPEFILAALSGIFQYGVAFWLYLFALKRLPVNAAAAYLNLIPIFGLIAAALWLGEQVGWQLFSGMLLILLAVRGVHKEAMRVASPLREVSVAAR